MLKNNSGFFPDSYESPTSSLIFLSLEDVFMLDPYTTGAGSEEDFEGVIDDEDPSLDDGDNTDGDFEGEIDDEDPSLDDGDNTDGDFEGEIDDEDSTLDDDDDEKDDFEGEIEDE